MTDTEPTTDREAPDGRRTAIELAERIRVAVVALRGGTIASEPDDGESGAGKDRRRPRRGSAGHRAARGRERSRGSRSPGSTWKSDVLRDRDCGGRGGWTAPTPVSRRHSRTDTADTAFALDLLMTFCAPVVVTGAQRRLTGHQRRARRT